MERLDGDLDEHGQRSGEVIVALLLREGETIRVRANLDAHDYEQADQAHMTSSAYVRVSGRLHPGRQPRTLDNIGEFTALLPGPAR